MRSRCTWPLCTELFQPWPWAIEKKSFHLTERIQLFLRAPQFFKFCLELVRLYFEKRIKFRFVNGTIFSRSFQVEGSGKVSGLQVFYQPYFGFFKVFKYSTKPYKT
uniref:Uncharacterized protein n=1 Tax=Pseudochlorodesmis sp. HV01306b TaxID=2358489 RepID=A0A386AYB2_9CHLO|nr:hypothetical protein [Pseudochlorodesmis sp. HV01306b]